jgi:hypothetical protein
MVDAMDPSRRPHAEQQLMSRGAAIAPVVLISLAQQGRCLLMLPTPLLTGGWKHLAHFEKPSASSRPAST